MKFCNLASGSKGNCSVVFTDSVTVMIDDGLNIRALSERARLANLDLSKINAIIVTHEHSDHVKGIASLAKKYSIPVYCHPQSRSGMEAEVSPYYVEQDMDAPFEIGDLLITPFRLPHDSNYNLGYKLSDAKHTVTVATDLGSVNENILQRFVGSDLVMLESNHDVDMLRQGNYPFALKQRILGKNGHLSNDDCAATISQLCKRGTKRFILAHLSQDNNTPELAFNSTAKMLENQSLIEGFDAFVDIAYQHKSTKKLTLE